MKTILSLAVPGWVGVSIGAAIDDYTPNFWWVWTIIGIILTICFVRYIDDRRMT